MVTCKDAVELLAAAPPNFHTDAAGAESMLSLLCDKESMLSLLQAVAKADGTSCTC